VVSLFELAVVQIQSVLLAGLADAAAVGSGRNSTGDEGLIQVHLKEVKAVEEVFEIPESA
jgi:hypothetical protein